MVFLDRENSSIAVDPIHAVKAVVKGKLEGMYVNAQQCQFHVCTNWLGDVVKAGKMLGYSSV